MRAIFILLIFVILILSSCTSVEVAKQITKATNSIKTSIINITSNEEKKEEKISNEEYIEEKISKKYHPNQCVDCEDDGTILVNIDGQQRALCAWHWTKRYDRDHLELLYEQLKKNGLGKRKDETKQEWSDRCRDSLRGTKWGNTLGA